MEQVGVIHAFCTTDFDLTAYLMCNKDEHGKQLATLLDVQAMQQRSHNPGSGFRFQFFLCGTSPDTTVKVLKQHEMEYTNRQGQVEPIAFESQRKQLRVLLERHIKEHEKKHGSAPDYRSGRRDGVRQ